MMRRCADSSPTPPTTFYRLTVVPSQRTNFLLFSPTRDMADQSRTSRFQTQFESALQSYQRETGVTLAEHSLAINLQSCHSVESIITLLQNEALAFSDLPRGDIVMKSIQNSVSILSVISGGPSLDEAIDLVRKTRR